MTSTELNKEFTKAYDEILTYSKKVNYKFQLFNDVRILMSECYIYLEKNKSKIDNITVMKAMSKGFIKRQTFWTKGVFGQDSKLRRRCSDKQIEVFSNHIEQDDSIDYNTLMEKYDEFYKTLSVYDKGLFDIYHKEKRQITREIAEHLEISMTSAYDILLECRELNQRFKNFLLKYL